MNRSEDTIFWFDSKVNVGTQNAKKIATLNLSVGSKEKDEGIIKMNGNEYRIWKPYRSKLAAAILNGIEIFPILKKSKILYFDTFMENTINHISDIIGEGGKIFVPKNNETSNFLEKIKSNGTNISLINDINKSTIDNVDVLYVDALNQNYLDFVINSKIHLKNGGYLMLTIETEDIFENRNSNEQQKDGYKKIKSLFRIIQEINLIPFFKGQVMLIAKYYHS